MVSTRLPVVIGVDDKQPAAVKYAVAEADRTHRSLRVVHCWALPTVASEFYVGDEAMRTMWADGEMVLDDARSVVSETAPTLDAEYVIVNGAPVNALAQEAHHAAVLILGADDVPWFDRFLGGEVSGYLARTAACPVVVVPEREVPGTGSGGVVVTIDGDTAAVGPLRYAFEQADARHEQLHVLHAFPEATRREDFQNHCANVGEVVAGLHESFRGVTVVQSPTGGTAAEDCIEATSEASLVVIGRHHGHFRPFARARPIAMTVLRKAQCPVAVVPLDYGQP